MLHQDIVPDARSRTIHFPRYSGVTVILIVQLVHQDQLIRRNPRSHGLLGLVRTGCSFQLRVRMLHCILPAFVDVTAKGLSFCITAAEFLDHAIDLFQLCGVIPRDGDVFLSASSMIFIAFLLSFGRLLSKRIRCYYCR